MFPVLRALNFSSFDDKKVPHEQSKAKCVILAICIRWGDLFDPFGENGAARHTEDSTGRVSGDCSRHRACPDAAAVRGSAGREKGRPGGSNLTRARAGLVDCGVRIGRRPVFSENLLAADCPLKRLVHVGAQHFFAPQRLFGTSLLAASARHAMDDRERLPLEAIENGRCCRGVPEQLSALWQEQPSRRRASRPLVLSRLLPADSSRDGQRLVAVRCRSGASAAGGRQYVVAVSRSAGVQRGSLHQGESQRTGRPLFQSPFPLRPLIPLTRTCAPRRSAGGQGLDCCPLAKHKGLLGAGAAGSAAPGSDSPVPADLATGR